MRYLHAYKESRDALVLDLMEPLRPVVDRMMIEFIQSNEFHAADFTIRKDGVCRLNPQMAKRITLLSLKSVQGASAVEQLHF